MPHVFLVKSKPAIRSGPEIFSFYTAIHIYTIELFCYTHSETISHVRMHKYL